MGDGLRPSTYAVLGGIRRDLDEGCRGSLEPKCG